VDNDIEEKADQRHDGRKWDLVDRYCGAMGWSVGDPGRWSGWEVAPKSVYVLWRFDRCSGGRKIVY
jgi:hypothetical protein